MKLEKNIFAEELKSKLSKVAQLVPDDGYADKSSFFKDLYETIGKGKLEEGTNISSIEWADESLGESYVQVYIKDMDDTIYVEKYYESEHMQDNFGQTKRVKLNFDNLEETKSIVLKIIESI
tara:strand:+ start:43929 stop:44294 length:366 start_codon:yes stop_codon:yes gene_type:complete